jgi:hypothetical protein
MEGINLRKNGKKLLASEFQREFSQVTYKYCDSEISCVPFDSLNNH